MDADLDLLCTAVYCTADDLLPESVANARRRVTDAEVVALAVAQAVMGIPSDRRFLKVAARRLSHLFPRLPGQSGYHKRRRRLAEAIEWLTGVFAGMSPGFVDDLALVDSTPVECARSRETVKRSALADAAGYGYCPSHTRWFWGFRLHAIFATDGTPRAFALAHPSRDEREVGLELVGRMCRPDALTLIGDKGYAGRQFAAGVRRLGARIVRPVRGDEPGSGLRLAPIRQRIESIFWTSQGHPDLGAPRRAHPCGRQGAHRHALLGPCRLHQPQPPAGTSEPCPGRLRRLRAWNQSSRPPEASAPRAVAGAGRW